MELYIALSIFENPSKHSYPATYTLEGARGTMTLASILIGEDEFKRK